MERVLVNIFNTVVYKVLSKSSLLPNLMPFLFLQSSSAKSQFPPKVTTIHSESVPTVFICLFIHMYMCGVCVCVFHMLCIKINLIL